MRHEGANPLEITTRVLSPVRPWAVFYLASLAFTTLAELLFFTVSPRAFPPGEVAVTLATPGILLLALPHLIRSLLGVKKQFWQVPRPFEVLFELLYKGPRDHSEMFVGVRKYHVYIGIAALVGCAGMAVGWSFLVVALLYPSLRFPSSDPSLSLVVMRLGSILIAAGFLLVVVAVVPLVDHFLTASRGRAKTA